jgi:hypothetical protein
MAPQLISGDNFQKEVLEIIKRRKEKYKICKIL